MLTCNCVLQSDEEQHRKVAHAALGLVHKLLLGQLDGSDGLDAAHNTDFVAELSQNTGFVNGLLYMCKQGRVEARHEALQVLQHFLIHEKWRSACDIRHLVSLGAMPILYNIATNSHSDSTGAMQSLAVAGLQGLHITGRMEDLTNAILPALHATDRMQMLEGARSHDSIEKSSYIGAFGRYPWLTTLISTSVLETQAAN